MASEEHTTHGGRRDGAGRPLKYGEPTRLVAAHLPESLLVALDEQAAKEGLSRAAAISAAVGFWLSYEPSSDE